MKQAPEISKQDLIAYGNFTDEASIPQGIEKQIRFASDIVMSLVMNNLKPSLDSHVLAVKKAICCQVSYWVETGKSPVSPSDASSYTLGELSVSIDPSQSSASGNSMLCDLARMYLNSEHLLYRGMRHGRF